MNHIAQNVPVTTAADWATEVVKFCRGQANMSKFVYLKQDNVKRVSGIKYVSREYSVFVEYLFYKGINFKYLLLITSCTLVKQTRSGKCALLSSQS